MIRSTRHHLKDLNKDKRAGYNRFVGDYRSYISQVIDSVWKDGYQDFSIEKHQLDLPKYLNYKDFDIDSDLSARARSSAVTQGSQIIRSVIELYKKELWKYSKSNKKRKTAPKLTKPSVLGVVPNLSSKCCDFQLTPNGKFYGFVKLKSLGKSYGSISIPVVRTPRIKGKLKAGVLFTKKSLQLVWDVESTPITKGTKVIGIDQGYRDVVTCSDGQVPLSQCPHGHSLESITKILAKKKKGSKAFRRVQSHRENFVNWSINQLNFDGVKEVRIEKICNIRYQKKSSRLMSHWCNPLIVNKLKARCEELEVPVKEQSSAYRSQRCSNCGIVRKANRKGKAYLCKHCGLDIDADLNAALNHSMDLPDVPKSFLGRKLNLGTGFYWLTQGFRAFDGSELRVPTNTK